MLSRPTSLPLLHFGPPGFQQGAGDIGDEPGGPYELQAAIAACHARAGRATDTDWPLTDAERSPVLAALAYVCDPEDIIPDDIPGIGLLDDRDLAQFLAGCHDSHARPASDSAFFSLMNGHPAPISWQNLPIRPIVAVDVPKHFNFEPAPRSVCPREK